MHCQLNDDTPLGRNNHAFTGFSRPESRNSNHINADTRAYQVPLTTDLGLSKTSVNPARRHNSIDRS